MQIALVQPMRTSTANIYTKTRQFSSDESTMTRTGSAAFIGEGASIKKSRMKYTAQTVTARAMKLQAVYSSETAEDAYRDGNVNFETDMVRDLADEITGEIDYTVLQLMFSGASAGNVAFSTSDVASYESRKDAQMLLWDSIVDANNYVFTNMQRNANYIVGDATAVGRLEKLQQFTLVPGNADDVFSVGSVRVGTAFGNQRASYSAASK